MGGKPDVPGPSPEEQAMEEERKQRDKELQEREIKTMRRRSSVSAPSLFDISDTLG